MLSLSQQSEVIRFWLIGKCLIWSSSFYFWLASIWSLWVFSSLKWKNGWSRSGVSWVQFYLLTKTVFNVLSHWALQHCCNSRPLLYCCLWAPAPQLPVPWKRRSGYLWSQWALEAIRWVAEPVEKQASSYRKAATEGRNGKDNTVDDSEAKLTTTKDLYALFIGQAGTTALKSLWSPVLAAPLWVCRGVGDKMMQQRECVRA